MAEGLATGQSAERYGIPHYTSFMRRHKYWTPRERTKSTELTGMEESDETFTPVSSKGGCRASCVAMNHTGVRRRLQWCVHVCTMRVRGPAQCVPRGLHGSAPSLARHISRIGQNEDAIALQEPPVSTSISPPLFYITDGISIKESPHAERHVRRCVEGTKVGRKLLRASSTQSIQECYAGQQCR